MENEELYIGSHVGMAGPDFYLGSVKEALSYGANTFMFYTGAPQNSFRKPLDQLKIAEGRALLKANGINEDKIIVHAPYLINAANYGNLEIYDLAIESVKINNKPASSLKPVVLYIFCKSSLNEFIL